MCEESELYVLEGKAEEYESELAMDAYEDGYKTACKDIIYAVCKGCNKDFINMQSIFAHVVADLRNDPEYKPKEETENAAKKHVKARLKNSVKKTSAKTSDERLQQVSRRNKL